MREMSVTVYSFDELSEEAQERAINELRPLNIEPYWYEDTFDTIRTAGKLIGLEIGDIRFDTGFYCIFDASYEYARGAVKAVRDEFPWVDDLCKVAKDLQDLQRRHFYSLSCAVTEGRTTNRYECFRFCEDYACSDLGDIIDYFAHWAWDLLGGEYEYRTSDEAIREMIEANGYEFTEDGTLL